MPSKAQEMSDLKNAGHPLVACFCVENQINCCNEPWLVLNGKICCCSATIGWGPQAAAAAAAAAVKWKGGSNEDAAKAAAAAGAAAGSLGGVEFQAESCYSPEQGICEYLHKCFCCLFEVQCPPGMDIGLGCCGMRCYGGGADARELPDATYSKAPDAPEQQQMLS
mmetsp:Transcript_66731/g.123287  ORF Transcript_66731/g.123287 Transcript_66731/m.123287 type:complete len:166 (+) Transcript_66731:70-567(+)